MIPKPTPVVREPKRLMGRSHRVSQTTRRKVLAKWAVCPWCGEPGGRLDIHHRLPMGRGGTDNPDNLVPLHRKCHRFIHDHPVEAAGRGFTVTSKSPERPVRAAR